MTPPISIGSLVEVIGPGLNGSNPAIGQRFRISEIWKPSEADTQYSDTLESCWYPASSLRLVEEELKIGDYAEVILSGNSFTGRIGKVTDDSGIKTVALYNMGVWERKNLRKLTPEEIAMHTGEKAANALDEIQELRRRIHDLEMSLSGFTNGPEPEYVAGLSYAKNPVRDRLAAIEKRLDVLEGERPEVCEDHRPMSVSYCYKADDPMHGTFEVNCPCGRKAKIELPTESGWHEV
jgi:hypothetical protein